MPPPAPGLRGPFWRVFPWDAKAPPGAPYTPEYILPAGVQTGGRFDLGTSPTLYLALEDPAHALAEVLQSLRGKRLIRGGHLRRKARGRAAVTWLEASVYDALPDLGDPATLVRYGIRPDDLASRERVVTQRISRACCTIGIGSPASAGGRRFRGIGTWPCSFRTSSIPAVSATERPNRCTSGIPSYSPRPRS